jgi:hypothetical protein
MGAGRIGALTTAMRIAHLYPKYHQNVGDHLVQRGIVRLLREHLGEFEYTPVPTRKAGPDAQEPLGITSASVDLLNRHDLVVIGGSNLYECSDGRWGVTIDQDALARLTAPVLLLGIGGGWSFAYPTFPFLPDRVADDIKALHARARGSSVRDHMTQRILDAREIGPSSVTGCPATYLASEPLRPVRKGVVGIPFLPQRMHAPPSLDPRRRASATHRRRRLVTRFFRDLLPEVRRRGWEPRVLVHDAADLPLARQLLGNDFFYSDRPEELLETISVCDVIVGFRLHACIAGLGLGVPAIPILLDGRNDAFVETFGLTEHAVPIDTASLPMTLERLDLVMGEQRGVWAPAFTRRDALRKEMHRFLETSLSRGSGRIQ